jgi:hypothetical protein
VSGTNGRYPLAVHVARIDAVAALQMTIAGHDSPARRAISRPRIAKSFHALVSRLARR